MPISDHLALPAAIGLCLLLPCATLAKVPEVITDIPISGSLVQLVLGDLGQAVVLLPPGADAHDYQLRPSQARAVQAADLHVWIGPQLSPWMQRAQASLGNQAPSVVLLEVTGTDLLSRDDSTAEEQHHDHDHDHGPIDPHAWLDPTNAQIWLTAISAELAALDPEHAQIYHHNAETAGQTIAALQADLRQQLAPYATARFVVQHDAYAYFTRAFGLSDAIAVAQSDASQPSAARLRQIRQGLAAENTACAFPEANHNDRLLQAAIEGSSIRLGAALDPEGSTFSQGAELYAAVLEDLATKLRGCLSE